MNLLWPGALALVMIVPIMTAFYIWVLRRRRRDVVRYSSLVLVRAALPRQPQKRRHIPFAFFLLALLSLVIALGRPMTTTTVPAGQATIILAMDVSRSMLQGDIPPSRLQAAENAALSFIQRHRSNTQIGVVVFAGYAQLILPPTTDLDALQTVVRSLNTGRGTAIGNGIVESLNAIAEINENVTPVTGSADNLYQEPLPQGVYVPDIIVLLTDGVTTTGLLPQDAAQMAADRGVRIYTIGFGTEAGSDMFGGGFRRGIDEDTLREIAAMTGGEYYAASSASELDRVFASLPTYLITREETVEISVIFAAVGAILAAAAVLLSLIWNPLL
jgi:Ca-activated chloride channel homolog